MPRKHGPVPRGRKQATPKKWPPKLVARAMAPRALDAPEFYTPEELEILIHYGRSYFRGLRKGSESTADRDSAEEFRRKFELVWIFRDLPDRLRRHPFGRTTVQKVLEKLEAIGIETSERTLMRDYQALGGARWLRDVKPFARGEDRSSPLQGVAGRKKSGSGTRRKKQ
jgi:hypothetical protein